MAIVRTPVHFERLEQPRAHEYVAEQIRRQISLGMIRPGEALLPERELAPMFGVARKTVHLAVGLLAAEGRVVRRRGRYGGTFVLERERAGPARGRGALADPRAARTPFGRRSTTASRSSPPRPLVPPWSVRPRISPASRRRCRRRYRRVRRRLHRARQPLPPRRRSRRTQPLSEGGRRTHQRPARRHAHRAARIPGMAGAHDPGSTPSSSTRCGSEMRRRRDRRWRRTSPHTDRSARILLDGLRGGPRDPGLSRDADPPRRPPAP